MTIAKQKEIVYEQPLNELMRACLRLEYLFKRLDLYLGESRMDRHTQTITTLIIDLLNLLDRPDLKSKIAKEFNHFLSVLSTPTGKVPRGENDSIKQEIADLKRLTQYFLNTPGKIAQPLRDNLFLSTIRQYLLSPGGDSCIDAPHYFYWLNQSADVRAKQIEQWNQAFNEIREASVLLLSIVRNSGEMVELTAEKGFYHESLNAQSPVQLIRVFVPIAEEIYPEISAGRHRVSVRFVVPNMTQRSKQTPKNIPFRLMKCSF